MCKSGFSAKPVVWREKRGFPMYLPLFLNKRGVLSPERQKGSHELRGLKVKTGIFYSESSYGF